mmetsp:Transcript_18043/g.39421  ORF Transcript_18043/g.39421 Transcript_18043/m.39421 type:complete len:203 (-) Transcript_18043:209-817(-)
MWLTRLVWGPSVAALVSSALSSPRSPLTEGAAVDVLLSSTLSAISRSARTFSLLVRIFSSRARERCRNIAHSSRCSTPPLPLLLVLKLNDMQPTCFPADDKSVDRVEFDCRKSSASNDVLNVGFEELRERLPDSPILPWVVVGTLASAQRTSTPIRNSAPPIAFSCTITMTNFEHRIYSYGVPSHFTRMRSDRVLAPVATST